MKEILSGRANRNFLVIFEGVASKLEKIDVICSSYNPFPYLPCVTTDDWKQFQCHVR